MTNHGRSMERLFRSVKRISEKGELRRFHGYFLEGVPLFLPSGLERGYFFRVRLREITRLGTICGEIIEFPGISLGSDNFPIVLAKGAIAFMLPPQLAILGGRALEGT